MNRSEVFNICDNFMLMLDLLLEFTDVDTGKCPVSTDDLLKVLDDIAFQNEIY